MSWEKSIDVCYIIYICMIILLQNSAACCSMSRERHGIRRLVLRWSTRMPNLAKGSISAQYVIRDIQLRVLCNDICAMSVELNPSSSAICVIAVSVTTTTSKHISFCMRDDHFCSEFVNSFMDCNNDLKLCTYSMNMLFTSIPLCIIFPAAYPACLCLWEQF